MGLSGQKLVTPAFFCPCPMGQQMLGQGRVTPLCKTRCGNSDCREGGSWRFCGFGVGCPRRRGTADPPCDIPAVSPRRDTQPIRRGLTLQIPSTRSGCGLSPGWVSPLLGCSAPCGGRASATPRLPLACSAVGRFGMCCRDWSSGWRIILTPQR